MAQPTFGTEYPFLEANAYYIHVAALDATHFVVVYEEESTTYGICVAGEISNGVISYGTPATFYTSYISQTEIAVLDSTHFVVSWWGNNIGRSRIGTVSGTAITYGTAAQFNSSNTGDLTCTALDSTHFVVAYKDYGEGMRGKAVAGTVSGTTITFGVDTITTFSSGNYNSLASLDSTHFILTYNSQVRVGTVNGTSISLGAESTFHTGGNSLNQITVLDSTHFVIAFRDTGNSNYGTAIAGLVSGTSISSYGTKSVFNSADSTHLCITSIDDKYFVVGYKDIGNSDYGTSCVGYVIGTSIDSYGGKVVFNSGSTDYIDVSLLTNPNFVVAYRDVANSYYGTSLCGKAIFFVPQINII